jgi:hypothetical protein
MKRSVVTACCAVLVACGCASGQAYYGFEVGVTNAPPPPRIYFESRPAVVAQLPGGVYVVDVGGYDCDMFRYGGYWYVFQAGYWYRSGSYRGPYRVVDVRSVPSRVIGVPAKHWRHHPHGGPPGQKKKHGRGYES